MENLNTKDTKNCYQCLSEMPKRARKCAKCGSKQPSQILKVAAIIIGLIVLWTMITSSFEDSAPVVTETYNPPVPVQQSSFELGKYKVESEEFAYINPKELNLWKSYSDRTKVGTVSEGSVIEVIEHDSKNDYCKIKTDKSTGWVACGWLVKQ